MWRSSRAASATFGWDRAPAAQHLPRHPPLVWHVRHHIPRYQKPLVQILDFIRATVTCNGTK